MPDGPFILAMDLGTSGPKAALVSCDGCIAATARAAVETLHLGDGGVEQDPEAVWSAVKRACAQVVRESGVSPHDVLAVICSSQYSSIVPVDAEGRAAANMILWLDPRGSTERLAALPGFPRKPDSAWRLLQWLRRHGLAPVAAGMSLNHMRYVRYAHPEVYARTATFLEPMDFVTMRLCGRASANQCTAFMMLSCDNRRLDATSHDSRLLRYSLIDAAKLPPLVPVDAVVGTLLPGVAAELGLSAATRVLTGINDTQAGGIATAAFAGTHAALSIGSTSVMITHLRRKRTDLRHALFSMPSPVPDTWFVMAENGTAGATLEHFLERLVYAGDHFGALAADNRFALLQRAVDETPPGSGGVLFLPWMGGSLAPAAESSMRGAFLNLGLDTSRSHLARAVLEGVAMNLRWLRTPVERFARRRLSHFLFYGGGAESDAWAQILADVLAAPVHQLANPQYVTCVGAALLAFERLGMLRFADFEGLATRRRVYQPRPASAAVYDRLFPQFERAFRANRPIFRALNRQQETR